MEPATVKALSVACQFSEAHLICQHRNPIQSMMPVYRSWPLAVLLSLAFVSCGDDPKLVEKRAKQRAEIADLKGELELLDERLKQLPPDVTDELSEARKASEEQSAEVAKLEAEVDALEKEKLTLQAEFDAYQAKYRTK